MTATTTTSVHEQFLAERFSIDETPFSRRWRGVVLGIGLAASTALQATAPAHARKHVDTSSTLSSRLPGLASWDVEPTVDDTARSEGASGRSTQAVEAVDRIRGLLGYSEERVAELVGVARGSLRNWRTGVATPYPATVRRLFEIDGVLAALEGALGSQLRLWLGVPGHNGQVRLETLRLADGPSHLGREAAAMVFTSPLRRRLPTAADLEDGASADVDAPQIPAVSRPFAGLAKPRRDRS